MSTSEALISEALTSELTSVALASEASEALAPDTIDVLPPARPIAALVSQRVIAREALIVAVMVAGLVALCAPGNLGSGLHPHPAWAAVILLSARYGCRGFAFAVSTVWGVLTLAALCLGLGLGPVVVASNSPLDLAALMVSVVVAWVASAHERRIGDLFACQAKLARRSSDDGATIIELRDAALALRARADRLDHALTFIRNVATRLEGGDPMAGSQAALELAIARTGARAGVVQLIDRRRLRTFASLGTWTLERPSPPDVFADRTIVAAFEKGASVLATDLPGAGRDDSDVATPIVDETGKVLGVLALRGVPADSLCRALVHDLRLIGHWCAKPNASQTVEIRPLAFDLLEPEGHLPLPSAPANNDPLSLLRQLN